jgi:hypothetical protein
MKKLISILALVMGASSLIAADAANDVLLNQRNGANNDNVQQNVSATANALFAFNGSLAPISTLTPTGLTSLGVNSVTAAASTPLTLTGGSTGASLVLGNANTGASLGGGGLAVGSSASFVVGATAGVVTNAVGVPQISASSNTYSSIGSIAHNTTDGNHGFVLVGKSRGTKASPTILADGDTFGEYAFVAYDGAAYRTSAGIRGIISGTPGAGDLPTRLSFSVAADGAPSTTERMNLMPTGNLLIGTTTDITGTGGLHVAGTGTASTTTSGALRVGSNVGLSGNAGGASYFGGNINAVQGNFSDYVTVARTGSAKLILTNNTAAKTWEANAFSDSKFYITEIGGDNWFSITNTTGRVNLASTTSASSSTVGALTIGNGTAATNVAIGGGNVNAGGNLTALGTASIGGAAVSDPLLVQGGGGGNIIFRLKADQAFYLSSQTVDPATAGATLKNSVANYFRGGYWNGSASVQSDALIQHVITSTTPTSKLVFQVPAGTEIMSLASSGVATFAGAVSLSTAGTTISIKSGTNAAAGTVTLTGGAGTITSTAIDVNTVIVMSIKTKSGSFDHAPSVVVAAGSATIDGHNNDASTYNWVALKVN